MEQPTKIMIEKKLQLVLEGKMTREEICEWAADFIRNDESILMNDISAWHYLIAISNIDEMIAPNKYLFSVNDIKNIMQQY